MSECGLCRYFRILKDGTKKCRCKIQTTKDKEGNCEQYERRWPEGITIPDLKESV